MTVHIVNYGMGNVGSIANMIRKVGGEAVVTSDAEVIGKSQKLVLPGVGAFDQGMRALSEKGLLSPLRQAFDRGIPVLGICLGMQLMMQRSEEGTLSGLGLVSGDVRRFPIGAQRPRIPHMGWNRISLKKANSLFEDNDNDRRYYFVHSYYVCCEDPEDITATTLHGLEFVSAFNRGNLYGVQFHPEKSHRFGMAIFRRFLDL